MDAMDALAVLRSADVPLALVHDEYGHLDGIVTPGSILAALAGTFAHDVEQGEEPPLVERDDGSWLVSGAASADLLADRLGVNLPDDRDYSTVAGFALSVLKHLPETGETFRHDGWTFEIVDMDGRKIDKLHRLAGRGASGRRSRRPKQSARASRTSARSRRCRRGRDSRPARRSGRASRRPRKAPSCASSRSISVGRQAGELLEAVEAERVQRVGELRADALQLARDRRPARLAPSSSRWTGARRISPVTSLVAAAASPARPRPSAGFELRHVRPDRRAVGQLHALPRPKQEERQRRAPATTTISHQYSRIKSIRSPIPLRVVTAAKLDQIGEQQAEKEAQQGASRVPSAISGRPPRLGRPGRAADAGHLAR